MADALSAVATNASPRAVAKASWSGIRKPPPQRVEVEPTRTTADRNFAAILSLVFIAILRSDTARNAIMEQIPCRKNEFTALFRPGCQASANSHLSKSSPSRPLAGWGLLRFKAHDRLRFSASAAKRKKLCAPIRAISHAPSLGDKAERHRTGRIG